MDWESLLKEAGPNGVLILFLIYAARWLAIHVAKPLVEGHNDFLKATTEHQGRTDRWLEQHSESLQKLAEQSATQTILMEKLADQRRRTGK